MLSIIKKKRPTTIESLIYLGKKQKISEKDLLSVLTELEREKKISLASKANAVFHAQDYFSSAAAAWYWVVLIFSILAALSFFFIPENALPMSYFRNFFGLLLTLFLPGYSLLKLVNPKVTLDEASEPLDIIVRGAISLGLSIAVTPFVGLIFYYSPLGIIFSLITSSLCIMTVAFSTLAVWRDYKVSKVLYFRKIRKDFAYFEA